MLNLILSALPALGSLIAGGKGEAVAAAGEKIAREVFGTTDEAEIAKRIDADPVLAERFKAKLEAETEQMRLSVEDVQHARNTTVALAQESSLIAWAPILYSGVITIAFVAVVFTLLYRPIELTQGTRDILNILLGVLTAELKGVGAYFLGSSAGSVRNGDALRQIAQQATTPTAGQMAGKVIDAAVKTAGKR